MNQFSRTLQNDGYEAALNLFEQAVSAFSLGDIRKGDALLATLDLDAIERDMAALRELGRTSQPPANPTTSSRTSKTVSRATQRAVQVRDRYHCRFTGRRLIDTNVFHEVSRISGVFHFDSHHSVRETERGPAGHAMVRTHAAAYEHVDPHSCGGASTVSNIVHTSVQLNESKGARILPLVDVPNDSWMGMTEHLGELRCQKSATKALTSGQSPVIAPRRRSPARSRAPQPRITDLFRMREAAADSAVSVFSFGDPVDGEDAFRLLRATEKNWYFATQRNDGRWAMHRLKCSSLDFSVKVKLTRKPKVCSAREDGIREWAKRFGVELANCARC